MEEKTMMFGDREYVVQNKAEEIMLNKWKRVLDKAEKDINFKVDEVTDMKFVNAETGEVIKTFGTSEVHTERNTKTLIQAIPIPLNATNGEVIKAVFPKAIISYDIITDCMSVYFEEYREKLFDKEWWDSAYSESNPIFK